MDILLGLVIATGLVYGWARGWLLVAIFLTLGLLFGMVFLGFFANPNMVFLSICLALAALIWAPCYLRRETGKRLKS